jgi:hypothetical protein
VNPDQVVIELNPAWASRLGWARDLSGFMMLAGLVLLVMAVVIGATGWAMAHNQGQSMRGRWGSMMVMAVVGAIILGSLSMLAGWGWGLFIRVR